MTDAATSFPTALDLRRAFDSETPMTVGAEEEVMLLDRDTLDLLPRATDVLAAAAPDSHLKGELPASQLELVTPVCATVPEVAAALRAGRQRLARAVDGIGRLAATGAHPFTAAEGVLSNEKRYEAIKVEYGRVARRQLVFGLHVHVAVRPARRAIAVYNALRSHLPELAALAANAPFHEGADTGLASVRPKLCEQLPRQGIPPPLHSLEELAEALRWGRVAGAIPTPGSWWWELRLHPQLGTIEVRVCDAQRDVTSTASIVAVIHALCLTLAERADAGDLPPPDPTWRIEQNRWSAARHGLEGTFADLRTGRRTSARERICTLLGELMPSATRLGCAEELTATMALVDHPAPAWMREVAKYYGLHGLMRWLADQFLH